MRMKILTVMVIMMAVAMAAPSPPAAVVIKLSQQVEVPVTITNLGTREVLSATTGADGGYTFDLSRFNSGWIASDTFRAEVLGLTKDFKFSDPYVWITFDVGTVYLPPEPSVKCVINKELSYGEATYVLNDECDIYVKAEDYKPIVCNIAATVKAGETFTNIDEYCNVKVTAEAADTEIIVQFLALIGVLLGIGQGVKIFKRSDGTTAVQHLHPGIRGYHDVNTSHKDVIIRHPKGEVAPRYSKTADGKWRYVK